MRNDVARFTGVGEHVGGRSASWEESPNPPINFFIQARTGARSTIRTVMRIVADSFRNVVDSKLRTNFGIFGRK